MPPCLRTGGGRGERLYRAEHNKAPSMYEMEGASPGYVAPGSPVAWQTRHYAPPAGTGNPRDVPVSRYFPRPGVAPGAVPVSNGESISTAFPRGRARVHGNSFQVFRHPHDIHRISTVIRTLQWLSTGLCTAHPQATQRNSPNTNIAVAKCNQAVFHSDCRVNQLMFR
jgi:hypothetical protein